VRVTDFDVAMGGLLVLAAAGLWVAIACARFDPGLAAWHDRQRYPLVTPRERLAFREDCGCRLGSDLHGQPYWRPCRQHQKEDADFALWEDGR
jgi:hypothetical protein